jgi:hypothetical protein
MLPPDSGRLFFSTRQGRQSNCLLTVEVARHVAEALERRLVLPLCHTSPLGQHACDEMPAIPPQRQVVVPFSLTKALQARDLSRCLHHDGPPPLPLLAPSALPLTTRLGNATCLKLEHGRRQAAMSTPAPGRSACDEELSNDPELRVQLGLAFPRQLTLPIDALRGASRRGASLRLPPSLPPGDVFLHAAFMLFSKQALGRSFELCSLPREEEAVLRMADELESALGLTRGRTLCVHWRAEDFHHASRLATHTNNTSPAVAARAEAAAREVGARQVLLLTNARHEAWRDLLGRLASSGLRPATPRALEGTTFGCRSSYVYAPFAEMLACSRAHAFVGTPHSTFTLHIEAMRRRKRAGQRRAHDRG